MQRSDGIFTAEVLATFGIAASGEEGESERLLHAESSWEREVNGMSGRLPFPFKETPGVKYFYLWRRGTGCHVLEIFPRRHNLQREVGGETETDS